MNKRVFNALRKVAKDIDGVNRMFNDYINYPMDYVGEKPPADPNHYIMPYTDFIRDIHNDSRLKHLSDEQVGELCRVRLCNEDPDTMCLVSSTDPPKLVVIHRPRYCKSDRFVVDVDLVRKSPTIIDAYWGDCWLPLDVNHPIGCSPGDVITVKDAMRLGWVSATVALREW